MAYNLDAVSNDLNLKHLKDLNFSKIENALEENKVKDGRSHFFIEENGSLYIIYKTTVGEQPAYGIQPLKDFQERKRTGIVLNAEGTVCSTNVESNELKTWRKVMQIFKGMFAPEITMPTTVSVDHPIMNSLNPDLTEEQLQNLLKRGIAPLTSQNIPQEKVVEYHEISKKALQEALELTQFGEVTYAKAPQIEPLLNSTDLLDPNIFYWSVTQGVEKDIPAAAKDETQLHIFGLASQYNAAESPEPSTPPPGHAMRVSEYDYTQGPMGQRTNPRLFELVNAFLGNGGFNMLAGVLFPSNRGALQHGYLMPNSIEECAQISVSFQKNYDQLEQPCVKSHLKEGSVYLMMAAAPALGYSENLVYVSQDNAEYRHVKRLQYWAALANFNVQFNQTLILAKTHPEKTVVYHPCGVGLGVFANQAEYVAAAFRDVARAFTLKFQKENITNVRVQFEVYKGAKGPALDFAEHLKLEKKDQF